MCARVRAGGRAAITAISREKHEVVARRDRRDRRRDGAGVARPMTVERLRFSSKYLVSSPQARYEATPISGTRFPPIVRRAAPLVYARDHVYVTA